VWVSQLEQFEKVEKKEGRITYSGPIVASGRVVVVSSRGDVLAFDPQTGTETARLKLGSAVFIEPIAAQDKLFVLTDDARLIAVR
jgi:outer membrane protein assembly factor BamB